MARRRPSGDGMVRKRDDGRWEGRIVVGHKENGDSIFRYIYAPTQKELSAKLRQEIDAYQGGDLTEDSSMTLSEWLDRWLDKYMAGTVRPGTLQTYRRYADLYIKPTLGDRPLDQIIPAEIQKLYAHLKKRGRVRKHNKYGHQLSDSMVHCIHTLLHGAMGTAEQFRLIPRNPVAEVTVPKRKLPPKQILNDEQLDTFMAAIQADDIWRDFFYTELTTGLRLGEICGLRWENFDAEHGVLNIQRTIHVEKGGVLTVGDGRWEGRAVIGYDDKGLPKTKNVLAKTKSECVQKLKNLTSSIGKSESAVTKPGITLGQWLDSWYQTSKKPNLRPNTQMSYEQRIYNYIIPRPMLVLARSCCRPAQCRSSVSERTPR